VSHVISFAPPETPEVMELLRAGDVLTHCNNGHTLGIVNSCARAQPHLIGATQIQLGGLVLRHWRHHCGSQQ
jgi:predicted amidohydrolase